VSFHRLTFNIVDSPRLHLLWSINHQLKMYRALWRGGEKIEIRKFLVLCLGGAWKMSLSFFHSPVDHVDFLHNLYFSPRTYIRCWWFDWLHMERERDRGRMIKNSLTSICRNIEGILLKFSTPPEGRARLWFRKKKNETETNSFSWKKAWHKKKSVNDKIWRSSFDESDNFFGY
jgi:hypothetical protein